MRSSLSSSKSALNLFEHPCQTDQRSLYMTSKAPCYLQYETSTPIVSGSEHQASNLRCLLQEAHATGRLAVLPALCLSPMHNFGICREWEWETYFDLGGSHLVDATGQEHPLPIADDLPTDGVQTLGLRQGEHMPARARDYTQVIRCLEFKHFGGKCRRMDGRPPPSDYALPYRLCILRDRRSSILRYSMAVSSLQSTSGATTGANCTDNIRNR